jgi:hypothetical protein
MFSAWWGQSFVAELHRISEQAEKKLRVRKGSSVDFAERPTEITVEKSTSTPDGDKAPEKSALKKTVLFNGVVSESPKGTPTQSTTDLNQVNGSAPEELNKSATI